MVSINLFNFFVNKYYIVHPHNFTIYTYKNISPLKMMQIIALLYVIHCALILLLLPLSALKFGNTCQNTHLSILQPTLNSFKPKLSPSSNRQHTRKSSFLYLGTLKLSSVDDASMIKDPKSNNDLPKFLEDSNILGAVRFGENSTIVQMNFMHDWMCEFVMCILCFLLFFCKYIVYLVRTISSCIQFNNVLHTFH